MLYFLSGGTWSSLSKLKPPYILRSKIPEGLFEVCSILFSGTVVDDDSPISSGATGLRETRSCKFSDIGGAGISDNIDRSKGVSGIAFGSNGYNSAALKSVIILLCVMDLDKTFERITLNHTLLSFCLNFGPRMTKLQHPRSVRMIYRRLYRGAGVRGWYSKVKNLLIIRVNLQLQGWIGLSDKLSH